MNTFRRRQCPGFITTTTIFLITIIFATFFYDSQASSEVLFHHHHHHQIIDYLPPQFFPKTSSQLSLAEDTTSLLRQEEDAQLVDALNHQLIATINGAQVLTAYLDADLLRSLSLAELTEELTFLTDAYLQPALTALDDATFHRNLLRFLPRIANDTAKLERLFSSLNEYLPPYSAILKALLLKSAAEFLQKNCTKTSSSSEYHFVPTSIVLENGFEYHFHLVAFYARLLKVPALDTARKTPPADDTSCCSPWHSTIIGYPLANTEALVDLLLTELLPPLSDFAAINSTTSTSTFLAKRCSGKLLRKVSDCLTLIKGRLKALSQMSSKTTKSTESRLLEKIEAASGKLLIENQKIKVKT